MHAGQQTAGLVRHQLEASRPASHEELESLRKEVRALSSRLDKLEQRGAKKKSK